MTSALDLAERRLGPNVLIVGSTNKGDHVEIEIESDLRKLKSIPQPNREQNITKQNFSEHLKTKMSQQNNVGKTETNSNIIDKNMSQPKSSEKNNTSSTGSSLDYISRLPKEISHLDVETNEMRITIDAIQQDIADLKALATSVIISDRLASDVVREEFLSLRLRELGFSPNLLSEVLGASDKKESLTLFCNLLARRVAAHDSFSTSEKKITLVAGASGSGKTTLVAKISADLKMAGKKIGILDTDRNHVAAGDSLRSFGRMLDVDVLGIKTDQLPSLDRLLERYDHLVIDMPSSLLTAKKLCSIFETQLDKHDIKAILATSCSTSPALFDATLDALNLMEPDIALTKLDEAPIEFRLIDRIALYNKKIVLVAGGTDITEVPEIASQPFLAQYLMNEIHHSLKIQQPFIENSEINQTGSVQSR